MTEPIDILAIASRRLHEGRAAIHYANMMQASAEAEAAHLAARIKHDLAVADMDAAQRVARQIAAEQNVVEDCYVQL